jgi:hypothetical protein
VVNSVCVKVTVKTNIMYLKSNTPGCCIIESKRLVSQPNKSTIMHRPTYHILKYFEINDAATNENSTGLLNYVHVQNNDHHTVKWTSCLRCAVNFSLSTF